MLCVWDREGEKGGEQESKHDIAFNFQITNDSIKFTYTEDSPL